MQNCTYCLENSSPTEGSRRCCSARSYSKMIFGGRLTRFLGILALFAAIATGISCSLDPNVRKQKFFEQGNRQFELGNCPEALLYYGRALQIDSRFAEARFKMAQCHMKQQSWAAAFRELQQTVDLQPDNWLAQLDLGQLLLAAGKAQDRSLLILRSNPGHADAEMLLANSDSALGNLKDALEEATEAIGLAPDR